MNLSILTPKGSIFNGEVNRLSLPGTISPFQVLPNHAPTLSSLTAGKIAYTVQDKTSFILVKSGLASIADNQVTILCKPIEKE